jgi:hypothetical protein
MTGHVTCMRKIENEYKIVVGNLEGKRPLGKPWSRWKDNIKKYLNK